MKAPDRRPGLGKYRLGVSDGWVALRAEELVRAGTLRVVSEAPADEPVYRRTLKSAPPCKGAAAASSFFSPSASFYTKARTWGSRLLMAIRFFAAGGLRRSARLYPFIPPAKKAPWPRPRLVAVHHVAAVPSPGRIINLPRDIWAARARVSRSVWVFPRPPAPGSAS